MPGHPEGQRRDSTGTVIATRVTWVCFRTVIPRPTAADASSRSSGPGAEPPAPATGAPAPATRAPATVAGAAALTAAGLLLAVSFAALAVLALVQPTPLADVLVYRAEGAAVLHGQDLYAIRVTRWRLPATYPPFAALLFVPAAWLPVFVLKAAFLAVNGVLTLCLVRLSCRFAGLRIGAAGVCVVTAFALWLEPVFQTLLFGQINLALTCAVLWDLTRPRGTRPRGIRPRGTRPRGARPPGTRPRSARLRGAAVGIAAGIKLTPAIFIVYLLLRRRYREAGVATAACAGTVLLGALFLPGATVDFFTRRVFETGRVGRSWIVDNQSMYGLLTRLLHQPALPETVFVLATVTVAMAWLWLAARVADERWGVLLTAVTALLVSPISWSHHWVWCVPLIALLLADGRRGYATAAAVTVLFTARSLWLVPHQGSRDLHLPWWQQVFASPYPLFGLGLLTWWALRESEYAVPGRVSTRAGVRALGGGVDSVP